MPAYDPRGLKGMGLGYATSNRGACHLRAYVAAAELGVIGIEADPLEWKGKGELVKIFQDLARLLRQPRPLQVQRLRRGRGRVRGAVERRDGRRRVTADDVMKAGERIYNLERYYNNLAGFREGSDTLPKRFTEEASTAVGLEGPRLGARPDARRVLRSARLGDGVVPEEKLAELQIP